MAETAKRQGRGCFFYGTITFVLVLIGVMLVPDQPQALREMVRVTRPGGRVLLIAYGNPAEFEALHFFISAVQAVVPEFEGPPEDEPMPALKATARISPRRRTRGWHQAC